MWRIIGLLIVVITGISCNARSDKAPDPPGGGPVTQSDSPQSRLHHPAEHPLRAVPMLIGLPSKEMEDEVRQGKTLLGGSVGPPDGWPQAKVCEQCRMWKTDQMEYWQPLPKEFGDSRTSDAPTTGVSPAAPKPAVFGQDWPYGNPRSYAARKALIDNGTLHDGMTRAEAEAVLGPPTSDGIGWVDWYHNPGPATLHVAGYFRADVRDGKLYEWKTGNR